ncbi:MAG: MBL fold metallo-hydrolase, partial [Candidatus Amulumruptor sp.]|nr:MBL fold metallo-hydrolase [Candidatus Amulumruptor sp.]
MKIARFEFNLFGENTYILWDPETLDAAIVDPGMQTSDEEKVLADFITSNGLHPVHLINTHLHLDHTLGDTFVSSTYGLDLEAAAPDDFLGKDREAQA